MERKWKQTISEYVGKGHPDRVADQIANIIKKHAEVSATEVIVNRLGVYASGETSFNKQQKENEAKKEVRELLNQIEKDYNVHDDVTPAINTLKKHGFFDIRCDMNPIMKDIVINGKKNYFKLDINFKFIQQDKMLANQKKKKVSGDQEIVYYHKLDENDVHYWLREIDNEISEYTSTLDYKTLINMENKTANISISKTHRAYKVALVLIIDRMKEYFGIKEEDINICEFEGGSIFNDTGVTGRKLIVEKDGGGYPHGGGAYFGKDETKAAVYGYDILKKLEFNDSVAVYVPGQKLKKPFIKELK